MLWKIGTWRCQFGLRVNSSVIKTSKSKAVIDPFIFSFRVTCFFVRIVNWYYICCSLVLSLVAVFITELVCVYFVFYFPISSTSVTTDQCLCCLFILAITYEVWARYPISPVMYVILKPTLNPYTAGCLDALPKGGLCSPGHELVAVGPTTILGY